MSTRAPITLLTDFGTRDGYVAAMKGVIEATAPGLAVHDAGHEVPPQDVQHGAWVLGQYGEFFPPGSVHVGVVDPGVGTERAALVVRADERFYVLPDNGLVTWVVERAREWQAFRVKPHVHRPGICSNTFHGRDVFAYVAALLAGETPLAELTEPAERIHRADWPRVTREEDLIAGTIVHVDRYGNAISSITREHTGQGKHERLVVAAGGVRIEGLVLTYGDLPAGAPLALWGSSGHLEVSVAGGSAAERLHVERNARVVVELPKRN